MNSKEENEKKKDKNSSKTSITTIYRFDSWNNAKRVSAFFVVNKVDFLLFISWCHSGLGMGTNLQFFKKKKRLIWIYSEFSLRPFRWNTIKRTDQIHTETHAPVFFFIQKEKLKNEIKNSPAFTNSV